MELHKNLVREKPRFNVSVQNVSRAVPKDPRGGETAILQKDQRGGETSIFTTKERGTKIYGNRDRWCDDSSNLNGGRPMYFLLDKHGSSSEKTRGTNKLSIRASKTTGRLDNAPGERSIISPKSVNNFLEERPSEGKKDYIWSVNDRSHGNQTKDGESSTRFRLKEPVDTSTGQEGESVEDKRDMGLRQLCRDQSVVPVIPVEAGPFNKDTHNFNRKKKDNATMQELSEDGGLQYEKKDLSELLVLLKDEYSFRDETNKNILDDDEIERFSKFYCITNFCLLLSCDDSIFWLKNSDGVIYMWSRIDDLMIRGGCNMKEALLNFLFREENLYYVEEYTLKLIPAIKAKEEAKKWCEENNKNITRYVMTDGLLKPLEEKKEGSNKGGKQKK